MYILITISELLQLWITEEPTQNNLSDKEIYYFTEYEVQKWGCPKANQFCSLATILIFRFFSDFYSAILSEVLETSYNCKVAVATSNIMFHTTKPFSGSFIRNKDNLPRSHSVDFSSHFTSQNHITCSFLNQCKGNGITMTVQD